MSKKLPVLIINSYAGSLVVAAHQEGHPVIGSYEDGAYGLKLQRCNYPDLDYRPTVADWPKHQDLTGKLVIAHPPCSAFSRQNNTKAARGCGCAKFQQTKQVISYALANGAAALAVESVVGALEGARAVHDELAAARGYTVHRVLQDARSWVPQQRPRAWFVFLPKGQTLLVPPVPTAPMRLADIRQDDGTAFEHDVMRLERQRRMVERACGTSFARKLFHGKLGYGPIVHHLARELARLGRPSAAYKPRGAWRHHEPGSLCATAHAWCCSEHQDSTTTFLCRVLRLMDPQGLAGAVLGGTWWAWADERGVRSFYAEEYKAVMGFPTGYDLTPVRPRLWRTFLSRGVCPPVARWVLQGLQATVVGGRTKGWHHVPAGETLDLRPSRDWLKGA